MGARTRARTGTRIERRVEARGSLGTLEGVIKVGQKTSERGRHQRVTRSYSDKTRRPSEAVASC